MFRTIYAALIFQPPRRLFTESCASQTSVSCSLFFFFFPPLSLKPQSLLYFFLPPLSLFVAYVILIFFFFSPVFFVSLVRMLSLGVAKFTSLHMTNTNKEANKSNVRWREEEGEGEEEEEEAESSCGCLSVSEHIYAYNCVVILITYE